jgi:2-hydroxychromene-2-carboxylate isomerase
MHSLPSLEFWFEFGSNYSYLSVMRIESLAADSGVRLVWKPFLLGPIFQSNGWSSSPFVLQAAKSKYVWQDMARQCRKHGLAWTKPSQFPRRAILPHRLALVGADQPWIAEYCRRTMEMNFVYDRDIDSVEAVTEVLRAMGIDASAWIAQANTDSNKAQLRAQTEEAAARGIFGAPSFFVGEALYWGNDRLEDALQACAEAGH